MVGMPPLIKGLAFDVLIAAKTFYSDTIMADLNERRAKVVKRLTSFSQR